MENMEGRFKGYDPQRQREAANSYRLSEVKNKLMYSAERELHSFLRSEGIEGVRVVNTHIDSLDVTESEESGTPIFTGKVIADVTYVDGNETKTAELPIAVNDSQLTPIKEEILKALKEGKLVEIVSTPGRETHVQADMNAFKIVDDGTKYFKVYHTAAYGDLEPIGAVSKEEFEDSDDRGALLTEMFQDEALSWPAEVKFVGEYTEPEIVEAAIPADIQYVVHADPPPEGEESVPKETEPKWQYKVSDSTRRILEAEGKNYDALQARLTQRALSTFNDAWNSKHLGNMNIKDTKTVYDEASGIGEVVIEAEILDGKENRIVPFTVSISGTSMTLPDFGQLPNMLKEARVRDEKAAKAKAILTKKASQKKPLKRKASPMAPPNVGYQEVLRMPKDFLPKSLEVGDVIEVDGLKWKLSSKSEGQLSKEKDTGSHWTFLRCGNDGGTSKYRQDAY